jgi:hypothetical protein
MYPIALQLSRMNVHKLCEVTSWSFLTKHLDICAGQGILMMQNLTSTGTPEVTVQTLLLWFPLHPVCPGMKRALFAGS